MRLRLQTRGNLMLLYREFHVDDLGSLRLRHRKPDVLIVLTNKRPTAGTIFIRFLIYLKAIYGQIMKEIDFSTLATKSKFARFFPTVALNLCCCKIRY